MSEIKKFRGLSHAMERNRATAIRIWKMSPPSDRKYWWLSGAITPRPDNWKPSAGLKRRIDLLFGK